MLAAPSFPEAASIDDTVYLPRRFSNGELLVKSDEADYYSKSSNAEAGEFTML